MLTRTWTYGTRKQCTVADVIKEGTITAIICFEDGVPGEGYICLFRPDQVAAKKGEHGTLIFTKGGPTGGFWRYVADGIDADAVPAQN